jgi:hypothetical protein
MIRRSSSDRFTSDSESDVIVEIQGLAIIEIAKV